MSSKLTSGATSKSSQSNSQRRQRSRSTSRYADLEKPKKKKTLSATTSLVSIPNTIKLSMLNSGLLSFERVKLEARDQNNSLSQTIPDKPIELRHFVKLCEQRRKFPVLYKLEFQTAAKVETNSCRHANRKNNEEKNQNQKCIPYDYNRVVLEKMGRTPDSDYINASYVDSLLKPNAYIVTQGPTEETVNDFWRMIWQEKVSAIIMLTKVFDFTKVMCMQYWPPALDKKEVYGDIYIGIDKEEQLANFHIRTFRIWKQNEDKTIAEERQILQFHYTEWHSHTCPFSNAVLEFRRRVRAVVGHIITANSIIGPMLVHCNDGGGRSGVYMAIDANLELAEEEDCFHVFGYLKKIRQSRKGLIENVDQYKFVYDTLEEHIVCGKTWFSVTELSERLKAKAAKDPVTKMNHYQQEYAQICKQTPRFTIGDCAGGHRADNRDKNRDVLCVPPDNFRPYLTSFQGNAFTDYINAVFVDGYTKPREYIVTEWPLKHTVGEFWSLVYDQECSAVVVLLQPPPNSTTYPSFWPEKSKMEKYGPVFSVHLVSRKHYTNIKQWEYKINKKIVSLTELMAGVKAPTKTVQLFQLTCFPLGHKVPTSTNSLVALMNMVEQWRAKTDYGPVCVVSPDGRSRAGVYCAANACIEQVIQHGEVDIFQAVKTVRRQRPQLVENMMEYKYCYDLVLHYVLHYLNKDLKEKKFIEFGRGKVIPLTPDSSTDQPNEMSNTGKIVVKKRIVKIEKGDTLHHQQLQQQQQLLLNNGKMMQRKKKGRLYSLGGNEPVRKPRGRLDRLKTVGTFDLGTEMSVLSEVARNLNEKIISGDIVDGAISNRRLSTIMAVSSNLQELSELSTPSSGGGGSGGSVGAAGAAARRDTIITDSISVSKRSPCFRNSSADQFKSDLNNITSKKTLVRNLGATTVAPVASVRTQHSADDCIEKQRKSSNNKFRSLSNSSYMTGGSRYNDGAAVGYNSATGDVDISDGNQRFNNQAAAHQHQLMSPIETSLDSGDFKDKNSTNIVNISIKDSNKTSMSVVEEMSNIGAAKDRDTIDNDSDKIELDIRSVEDIYKCDTARDGGSGDDDNVSPVVVTFAQRSSQKPVLRKSKRIVRTDSEIFDENIICGGRNEIVLQANYDIQFHQEPSDCTAKTPPPVLDNERHRSSATSTSTNHDSRIESSDIDDICSPRDLMHKSTEESSRNMSTDELDTVFSDTTDLEQLERDYRELVRSNLQREYKSDGDSLDEVGKKRNDFLKWKNQSFENNFELYNENVTRPSNDTPPDMLSAVCSPADSNHKTSTTTTTTNSSETSSNHRQHYDEHVHFAFKTKVRHPKAFGSSNNSVVTSPTIVSAGSCDFATKSSSSSIRPSKLDITHIEGGCDVSNDPQKTAALSAASSKDGTITSLFEKRFGKIKKINKLLKCKRFSTSALYDKKPGDSVDKPKFSVPRSQPVPAIETPQTAEQMTLRDKPMSACKSFRSKFSPGKSNISESKSSIYSSKLSLFNNRSIFSIRRSPMFSNASHSNTELNVDAQSVCTKLNEVSKSNGELNKSKSSISRFGSKRSIKSAVKVTSSNSLYKTQPAHSPLSEEFYNKTGSVRLSAMELYEKFCSEDFGGLYKHETMQDGSCGGYKNWHEFRLGQRGLGVTQKYGRVKNAKLLRQKSEPKFSFRDDTYFPEEDDEDIEEKEDARQEDEYSDQDDYEDEYEDEEGDYYEDEEVEEEEDVADDEVEEEIVDEPMVASASVTLVAQALDIVDIHTDEVALSNDVAGSSRAESVANDSDVDEIFLMPAGSKCTDDYEEYGFENKQFSLEHSMTMRGANSTESGLEHFVDHFDGQKGEFSLSQEVREIVDFGSDEILTIYKICSKDDILGISDAVVFKKTVRSASIADPEGPSSLERAVSVYVRNAAPDIEIEPSIYKTDCTSSTLVVRSESIELLSSSSGTLRSGSTLTEYAFDTVRNLNLDSCSTSKLSLSLKSEIFDDYTITPDDQEPRMQQSCEFEDFTLTPDGSFSESYQANVQVVTLEVEEAQTDLSITSKDMLVIVDKFLANERSADAPTYLPDEIESLADRQHLQPKITNYFSFVEVHSDDAPNQLSFVDLDEDDTSPKNVVSAFTTEITREFDLLFSRAQHNDEVMVSGGIDGATPPLSVPLCDNSQESTPSAAGSNRHQPPQRLPSRYSMQYLEPYIMMSGVEVGNNGGVSLTTQLDCDDKKTHPSGSVVEYCKVLSVHDDAAYIPKRIANKLKKNRSQSLGNLSNKTRCFPL